MTVLLSRLGIYGVLLLLVIMNILQGDFLASLGFMGVGAGFVLHNAAVDGELEVAKQRLGVGRR